MNKFKKFTLSLLILSSISACLPSYPTSLDIKELYINYSPNPIATSSASVPTTNNSYIAPSSTSNNNYSERTFILPSSTPSPVKPLLADKINALDVSIIEKLIYEKTNQERQKLGLTKLEYENKIASIARKHSENMAENNFFDHTDPQGFSSADRIKKNYPNLMTVGTAENIAYNFGKTNEEAASNLMNAWMNSEGHRKNILNSNVTYIGVGIYIKNDRIYGTQNFIKPLVLLESNFKPKVSYNEVFSPVFKFYKGVFDKSNLTIFVKFPDSTAKFYLPDNSYFTGEGKYLPQWIDSEHFTFSFTLDKGFGDYIIQICENNTCYDSNFKISTK